MSANIYLSKQELQSFREKIKMTEPAHELQKDANALHEAAEAVRYIVGLSKDEALKNQGLGEAAAMDRWADLFHTVKIDVKTAE